MSGVVIARYQIGAANPQQYRSREKCAAKAASVLFHILLLKIYGQNQDYSKRNSYT
jgi:hypothetical protein